MKYLLFLVLITSTAQIHAEYLDGLFGIYDQAVENTSRSFETVAEVRNQAVENTSRSFEAVAEARNHAVENTSRSFEAVAEARNHAVENTSRSFEAIAEVRNQVIEYTSRSFETLASKVNIGCVKLGVKGFLKAARFAGIGSSGSLASLTPFLSIPPVTLAITAIGIASSGNAAYRCMN